MKAITVICYISVKFMMFTLVFTVIGCCYINDYKWGLFEYMAMIIHNI